MQSIINILHKNFQEDHTNSRRFPGFPGVVDNVLLAASGCHHTVNNMCTESTGSKACSVSTQFAIIPPMSAQILYAVATVSGDVE